MIQQPFPGAARSEEFYHRSIVKVIQEVVGITDPPIVIAPPCA